MNIWKTRWAIALLVTCAAAAAWLQPPQTPGYAASPASLTLGKTVIPEGDDFATRVLGLPWNMNGEPYPDQFTALKNVEDFDITPGGFWEMGTANTDARIWLHWTGVGTTQRVLRMGDTRPIDASKYKLLSYYMCLDQAPGPGPGVDTDWGANVYWMYDRSPHDDPGNGYTKYILFKQQGRFKTPGTCELITFDLSKSSAWEVGTWDNSPVKPMGLRLDPINKDNKTYSIGWARLTTKDTGNVVPLNWNGAPAGTVKFYISLQGCGQQGIYIGSHPNPGGSGTFNWGAALLPGFAEAYPLPIPESFEPGDYFVYMVDANNGTSCASSKLEIHPAPILEFQKPSFYSGPDYSTNVVGDGWGMANSADFESHAGVTNVQFNNGIFSAVSTSTDPRLFLNVGNPIHSDVYRFATFRMKINGVHFPDNGWVQRYIWWYIGPGADSVTSQDIEIYSGWHTYTIDLETAGVENCTNNCWKGFPTGFRFDPHETPNATFFVDFITLTGIDTVYRGNPHTIYYTLPNAPGAEVTFFYDTDTNPANGRTPLLSVPETPPAFEDPLAVFKAYLPVLFQVGGEFDFFLNSLSRIWNTTPVNENTYYISADVDDGVMTTTWYSEAPVIVK